MGIVYQLTFFFVLGLLAIIVAIFVFSVSQIGRATESASKEQQDILNKQKEAKIKQIEQIEQQLAKAKKVGQLNESELKEEIKKSKEEISSYNTQLTHIKERVDLIRRKGAVIYPGIAFITSIILSISASGLFETETHLTVALWLWIFSIIILVFGIYRVFRTLGAIEQVTVTSQEAIEKLPEAVKKALVEIEETRRPELNLLFRNTEFPLKMHTNATMKLEISLYLLKSDIAEDIEVFLYLPQGFEIPDEKTTKLPADHQYANYIGCKWTIPSLKRGLEVRNNVTIKAPTKSDTYKMVCYLYCKGIWPTEANEYEIIVK